MKREFDIGEMVWFNGKKWKIVDHFKGTYGLSRKTSSGKTIDYGYTGKGNKEDFRCPFSTKWTHGFVPAIYLAKVLLGRIEGAVESDDTI